MYEAFVAISLVGAPNEEAATKFSDLNMLVMPGGRERTLDGYAVLLSAADPRLASATPTGAGVSVVEGVPA
ncbi:MAG TPA: hypothetical protein VIJ28_12870 [Chloroflexota bacterium]